MVVSKKLTLRAVAEITGLLIGAVSMIYISRVVGPEYIGFSATTAAFLLLISKIADGGLTSLASQRLARDDETLEFLLSVTLPPKLIVSICLIIITLVVAHIVNIDVRLKYFIKISVFIVLLESCTPAWVFVALGNINIASIIRISQSLLYALFVVVLVRSQADWEFLPYLTVLNSAINFVLATYFLWRSKLISFDPGVFKNKYFAKLKTFYREGGHFLKADLSVYIYTSSDRLILYYFTSPQVVGIYEAAYKIITPFYSINAVITPTMFRDLAQSFKKNKVAPVMAKYVFSMSIFSIPLGFFLIYFAKPVVDLLYGAKFAESVPSLMVLGFVITFGFTSGIIVQPFAAWNMSKEYGSSIYWGNVLNTALNFTLIPLFGAIGAALATLAAKVIVTVVGYLYFKTAIDYPIVKEFAYFFIASSIPLLVVYALSFVITNAMILGVIFCTVYILIIAGYYIKYFKARLLLAAS